MTQRYRYTILGTNGIVQDVTLAMTECYLPSARALYKDDPAIQLFDHPEQYLEELCEQHAMETLSEDLGLPVRKERL